MEVTFHDRMIDIQNSQSDRVYCDSPTWLMIPVRGGSQSHVAALSNVLAHVLAEWKNG